MIKNQDYSLLNKQISNKDMIKFCQIFEEKQENYTCEIYTENGPRYTYSYFHDTKKSNPFKEDFFVNMEVVRIEVTTKYCKLQYGIKTENKIMFEGDENDDSYQYFYTKLASWMSSLKKLKRFKLTSSSDYVVAIFYTCLLAIGLTIAYGFLSDAINNNTLSTVLSSAFLGLCLIVAVVSYYSSFLPYEIKIGLCKYKKTQTVFYSLFTLCIVPILTGLFA